ncbi:MAG: hypothetical protein IJV74_03410 [Clostridia bacterium]|nr:hypothetical protein [Clostridia bacterium]
MFGNITESIVEQLRSCGLKAGRSYPVKPIGEGEGCFVRVSVDSVSRSEAGFARFLGMEFAEDGSAKEIYGMRCELCLAADIYASAGPENAAEACERELDSLMAALDRWDGISINTVKCSSAAPDSETGLFRCSCIAEVKAMLTAEKEEEALSFSDFILKGEIK